MDVSGARTTTVRGLELTTFAAQPVISTQISTSKCFKVASCEVTAKS